MFKFKGISSEDMQVIVQEEEHFIAKAAQRYEVVEIEGADDALFETLGYSYVERPIYVQCLNNEKMDDILDWLNGEGELEYNDRKTIARFYSELDPIRNSTIKIIDATFIRSPFWNKANDKFVIAKDRKDKEISGENITIKDSAEARFKKLTIKGNTYQETREGYNLLNVPKEFEVTGTVSKKYKNIIPAGSNITISCKEVEAGGDAGNMAIDFRDSDSVIKSIILSSNTNTSIVLDKDCVSSNIYSNGYSYNNSQGITSKIHELMVNIGDTKEYEEYGAMPSLEFESPIKNCENMNFKIFNKNLIPELFFKDGTKTTTVNGITATIDNDNKIKITGTAEARTVIDFKTFNLNLKGNKKYQYISNSSSSNCCIETYTVIDGIVKYIKAHNEKPYAITADDLLKIRNAYIIVAEGQEVNTTLYFIMQEENSDILYIPHQEQSFLFPAKEGQLFHKDDYLADDGTHNKRKTIILDGTEAYALSNKVGSYQWFRLGFNSKIDINIIKKDGIICNKLPTYNQEENASGITSYNVDKRIYIAISEEITNVQQLQDYLSKNPLIIEFTIENEEIEPYSPEQQEAWDNIKNTAHTYKGITHIFCTDEINCEFEATYLTETNEKIFNEGNIKSRPIIRLEKTIFEEVEITINDVRFTYNFKEDNYVEIDCKTKTVTYEGLNRNRQIKIGYEFPSLKLKENNIIMHNGDCIVKIKRKDRWL